MALFSLFSFSIPAGVGPDSGAHTVNSLCANGDIEDKCLIIDRSPESIFRTVKIPETYKIYSCTLGDLRVPASCSEPNRSSGVSNFHISVDTTKGLNELLFVAVMQDYSFATYAEYQPDQKKLLLTFVDNVGEQIGAMSLVRSSYDKMSPLVEQFTLSIIPVVANDLIYFLDLGHASYVLNLGQGPKSSSSLAFSYVSTFISEIDSVPMNTDPEMVEATMIDNYNPPWVYKTYNLFIDNNALLSFMKIKVFHLMLMFLGLILSIYIVPRIYLNSAIFSLLLGGGPYLAYLLSTTNGSSLVSLGVVFILITTVGLLQPNLSRHKSILLFFLFVLSIYLLSARSDGPILALISIVSILFLKFKFTRDFVVKATLMLFFTTVLSFYFVRNFSVPTSIHTSLNPLDLIKGYDIHTLIEAPTAILGTLGIKGPLGLNTWGVFEYVPSIVGLILLIAISSLFLHILFFSPKKNIILLLLLALATLLVFSSALVATSIHLPGGYISARYILPLIISFIFLIGLSISQSANGLDAKRHTLYRIFTSIFIGTAYSIAIFSILARYINGLRIYYDGLLTAISGYGDYIPKAGIYLRPLDFSYGWSTYIPLNPYLIIFLVFFFSTALTYLVFPKWHSLHKKTTCS